MLLHISTVSPKRLRRLCLQVLDLRDRTTRSPASDGGRAPDSRLLWAIPWQSGWQTERSGLCLQRGPSELFLEPAAASPKEITHPPQLLAALRTGSRLVRAALRGVARALHPISREDCSWIV